MPVNRTIVPMVVRLLLAAACLSSAQAATNELFFDQSQQSIQDAINSASSGDVVFVHAGVYHESLRLKSDVTLMGEGAAVTILKPEGNAPVISCTSVQNCRIEHIGIAGVRSSQQFLVVITASSVTMRGVALLGGPLSGVLIRTQSSCTLEDSDSSGNGQSGVIVAGDSELSCSRCRITGNGLSGLLVLGRSRASVYDTRLLQNGSAGLQVRGASATLRDDEVSESEGSGIFITSNATLVCDTTTVRENRECGLASSEGSSATIHGSTFLYNNRSGIWADGNCRVSLWSNTLKRNREAGVVLQNRTEGSVKYNRILQNGKVGVCIASNAAPGIFNNNIIGNRLVGIWVTGGATPTVINNIITGSDYGISTLANGDLVPVVEYNDCWNNYTANFERLAFQKNNNLAADPLFNDAEYENYTLSASSPCIHAGERNADIGAIEFSGTVPSRAAVAINSASAQRGINPDSNAPAPSRVSAPSDLYVFAVGVSQYKDPSIALQFAAWDAQSIASAFKRQTGKLYHAVHTNVLVDAAVTRAAVLDSMQRFLGCAGQDDVVILFLAGHGIKHPLTESYYYLTYDSTRENVFINGLAMGDFNEQMKLISKNVRKVILFLDSCHSGALSANTRAVETGDDVSESLKSAEGLYVISASKAGESSYENSRFSFNHDRGHGLFTYAILRGLMGEGDTDGNRTIYLNELFNCIGQVVRNESGGKQHPHMSRTGTDIPLLRSDK